MQEIIKWPGADCVSDFLVTKECSAGVKTLEDVEYASVVVRIELSDNERTQNAVPQPPGSGFVGSEELFVGLLGVGRLVAQTSEPKRLSILTKMAIKIIKYSP